MDEPKELPVEVRIVRIIAALVFWGTYALFPIASGAWFYDQIDCGRMWANAVKDALSLSAYICLPFVIYWRRISVNGNVDWAYWLMGVCALVFGVGTASNVLHRCW